ncbi:MAG: KAP family P-loop domain protein, partial [Desulfobulbaceae bacterium]|nr:KAP family P-loop domain protein [Desulfobulbaceae bacterium]
YDDARASLLEVIVTELDKAVAGNEGLTKKAKRLFSRVNGFRFMGLMAEGAALFAGIPTGGMLARGVDVISGLSDGIKDKKEYETIRNTGKEVKDQLPELFQTEQKQSPPQQIDAFRKDYCEILEELKKPLIVMIDNLDRCLPVNAIHTLEAIRLFLFLTNTAFIIAADEEMIRSSVADYFKGASDRHQIDYLDKLIQVPIRVPKAGIREVRSYLFMLYAIAQNLQADKLESLRSGLEKALQQSWKDEPISRQTALAFTGEPEDGNLARSYDLADRIAPLLANSPIIHGNPRIVKRLLNVVQMRSQIAKRRSMPLDEAIITKLVIFERCMGTEATADFYRFVDAGQGKSTILKQLEELTGADPLPNNAPSSWINNATTKEFILEWAKLEPALKDIDLRAALYLSRETMPLGAYIVGLSSLGQEVLSSLVDTRNMSSPTVPKLLESLSLIEQVPVMEGIISNLHQVTDWAKQPIGFAGGCLLAAHSSEAAKIFKRFITGLELSGKRPAWMNSLLNDKPWYNNS